MPSNVSRTLYKFPNPANDPIVMANRRHRKRRHAPGSFSPIRSSRRTRRRDRSASSDYRPTIVASDTALRGVQSRLIGGVLTALLTLCCITFVLTSSSITMAVTFAFTIGTYSLAASIALLMSARQEEIVHQISHTSTTDIPELNPHPQPPHHTHLLHQENKNPITFNDIAIQKEHIPTHPVQQNATDGRL